MLSLSKRDDGCFLVLEARGRKSAERGCEGVVACGCFSVCRDHGAQHGECDEYPGQPRQRLCCRFASSFIHCDMRLRLVFKSPSMTNGNPPWTGSGRTEVTA